MGHEAWCSISHKGKEQLLKLFAQKDFSKDFLEKHPNLKEIDAACAVPFDNANTTL